MSLSSSLPDDDSFFDDSIIELLIFKLVVSFKLEDFTVELADIGDTVIGLTDSSLSSLHLISFLR
jgi:hypothetical protein